MNKEKRAPIGADIKKKTSDVYEKMSSDCYKSSRVHRLNPEDQIKNQTTEKLTATSKKHFKKTE